jgi:oxygen-dependent protoporphyrinogen oxidase
LQAFIGNRGGTMARVVIVGAGISGLALAYRLQQLDPALDITLLEQHDRPGGKIWTERREGFQVEIGPNGFLDTKPSTTDLCRDLGLGDRLLPASEGSSRNRYLFLDGRMRALPGGLTAFLRSDLLSWRGKLDLFLERFRRNRRPRRDESIDAFARRRAGPEAADVFADALVTGIHAGDPKLLSVRATFPRLDRLEEQYGSVLKGMARSARQRRKEETARTGPDRRPGRMWSFREGLRLLVETLCARLTRPPLLGVNVRTLHGEPSQDQAPARWVVGAEGKDHWIADAVVLACPAYHQAAILADLDWELANRVGDISYNRVAVIALGYRRADVPGALDGFGYIAPQRDRRDVLGVQWCSSIFPDRAPANRVLLRAMCGGWHRAEVAGWEDARLLEAVRHELHLAMGIEAAPLFHHIVRWDRAIPQYHLGHLQRVAWIEARLQRYPGLFLAGNAYHGVAMNDCTEQAEVLAGRIRHFLMDFDRQVR